MVMATVLLTLLFAGAVSIGMPVLATVIIFLVLCLIIVGYLIRRKRKWMFNQVLSVLRVIVHNTILP